MLLQCSHLFLQASAASYFQKRNSQTNKTEEVKEENPKNVLSETPAICPQNTENQRSVHREIQHAVTKYKKYTVAAIQNYAVLLFLNTNNTLALVVGILDTCGFKEATDINVYLQYLLKYALVNCIFLNCRYILLGYIL